MPVDLLFDRFQVNHFFVTSCYFLGCSQLLTEKKDSGKRLYIPYFFILAALCRLAGIVCCYFYLRS